MHKRDYDLLASALLLSQPGFQTLAEGAPMTDTRRGWLKAVNAIADALALENPVFKKDLFLEACGVKVVPKTGIIKKSEVHNRGRVWRG